jgi:hypothetical protein
MGYYEFVSDLAQSLSFQPFFSPLIGIFEY